MFRWFVGLLHDSTPAEFRSAYGLGESVERLSAATKRWALFNFGETMAVGKVSEKAVRLRRVIPMVHNSFQPIFTGHFEVRDGVAVLTGRFGMPMSVKVFMGFWFGMVILISGAMLLGGLTPEGPQATVFMWQPFLMTGGGIALVAAGKWFGRNDAAWLSGVIARALGTPRDGGSVAQALVTNVDADAVPMTLKVAAIVLGASGAMALIVGFTGPHVWPSMQPAASDAPAGLQLGNWNFVYAFVVLSLALGIWRRNPWAWWGGFVLLGLSLYWSLVAMPTDIHGGPPMGIKVIFAAFSCVVVAVWGRWWYAQRKHFLWG
jgi:hypothetical protein